jgi:hypothetical protein
MKKLIFTLILASAMLTACKKKKEIPGEKVEVEVPGNTGEQEKSPTQITVFNVSETMSAEIDRDRLQNNWLLTDFTPTGLYLAPNELLKLTVKQTAGTRLPKLLIGTYSRYGAWNAPLAVIPLKEGVNYIQREGAGLLWIRYTDAVPVSTATVTFNSGFVFAPYYKIGVTTQADWKKQLATSKALDVVMEGSNCYVVVEKAKAVEYQNEDQTAALNKIKQIIDLEDDLNGLDGSNALHTKSIYKYLLTQHEDDRFFMFANDYRTAYYGGNVKYILQNSLLDGENLLVCHELGHQHQQKWTWDAITEVSVNVFGLYIKRKLTGVDWLAAGGSWPSAFDYLAKPAGTKDYNGSKSYANPITYDHLRLHMFDQLRLAFGDNFFRDIARKTREEAPILVNDDAKMSYFMLSACKRTGKDLSVFFQKWGFNLSTSAATLQVYADIAALGYPAPIQDPSTLSNQ